MTLFLFRGSSSSFSPRFYKLALIILMLVCFCSYCSSSTLVSPLMDVDSLIDDVDLVDIDDEINYYPPSKLLSHHYRNVPEQENLPSKNHFRNLLLKSIVVQPDYRFKLYSNKRYASQGFHAMRG